MDSEEDTAIVEETDADQEQVRQDTANQVHSDASAMSEPGLDYEVSGESEDSESEDSDVDKLNTISMLKMNLHFPSHC